jgi:hypothetical protein
MDLFIKKQQLACQKFSAQRTNIFRGLDCAEAMGPISCCENASKAGEKGT